MLLNLLTNMLIIKLIKALPLFGIIVLSLELYAFITGCKIAFFVTVTYLIYELCSEFYKSFKFIRC